MDEVLKRIIDLIGPKHGASKLLADHLGIHPNVITNWKNGRNKSYRGYLPQIANYFGVSVDYLLGNEEKTPAEPDVTFDDFTYAMHNESKELSDADKEMLLEMARMMKERIKKEKRE